MSMDGLFSLVRQKYTNQDDHCKHTPTDICAKIFDMKFFHFLAYSKYRSLKCSNDSSTEQRIVVRAPIFGALAKMHFNI